MTSAISTRSNLVIRASAGTGKTFRLSNQFLSLIATGVPTDCILATTFTRKGAGEILDRILERLAKAAVDAKVARALASQVKVASLDQQGCLELLHALLQNLHRVRAGTLDSFFIQIARSFSLELGQSPAWQIIDEVADSRLRSEAIRLLLQEHSTSDIVRLMHLLTKGEASRSISRQLSDLVDDLYEIYLDAPPGAWTAISRRRQLSGEELEAALHALADAPLPDGARFATGREQDLGNARSEDWTAFLTKGIGAKVAAGETAYYRKPIGAELADAYQPLVDHARAYLLDQIVNQTEATGRLLERFDAIYRRLKTRQHAMRFQDVTKMLCGASLAERMDEVEYRLDGCIQHLLLDEFQDTNPAQWRVLRTFAARLFQSTQPSSFFCVGDVKQAIFGWRGGVAEIFDTLEGEFPSLALEPLNQSYRSSPPVIDTVNRVFENLLANPALEKCDEAARRWVARFEKHTTVHTGMPGYCRLLTAPAAGEGVPQPVATQRFAAERIARIRKEMPGHVIGVLVRKNEAVARMIYALRKEGIEASEEGGNPLTDSPAVQLVLSLLTLADHPGDCTARFHLATSPLAGCIGLADHEDDTAAAHVSLQIRRLLGSDGYGRTIYGWVQALAPSCDRRDLGRLLQLVDLAYSYDAAATARADDFVSFVAKRRVEDPTSADVRVMTYHQAKGLQFDIVVLPELDYPLGGQPPEMVVGRPSPTADAAHVCRYVAQPERIVLPACIQATFDAHARQVVEESLCVLYVALTRAVHALEMIIAPSPENEKTLRCTAAGLLRAALAAPGRAEPETTLYECGDARWYEKVARPPACTQAIPPSRPLEVKLASASGRQVRGLEAVSPSQLEGGPRVILENCLRLDSTQATNRGTLVHKWLEMIDWLEDGVPDDDRLRRAAGAIATAGLDLTELIGQFRAMLGRPEIAALLSRATYAARPASATSCAVHAGQGTVRPQWEVHREWPFVVRDGDTLLSGQMDRLVMLYDGERLVGADIVDFKTDRVSGSEDRLDARVEHYRPQLEAYRRAAAKLLRLPVEQVSARLVFLETGSVRAL